MKWGWNRSTALKHTGVSWEKLKGHEHRQSWLNRSYWLELGGRPWRGRARKDVDGGVRGWTKNKRGGLSKASPLLGTGQFEV